MAIMIELTGTRADGLTKAANREWLEQLVDQLPEGYLRDILNTEHLSIVQAISNDLCFIDLAGTIRQTVEERQELVKLQKETAEARATLKNLQAEARDAQRQLDRFEDARRALRNELKAL